jgi:hypothetical protein
MASPASAASSGTLLWTRLHAGDTAGAITVDPSGARVFVGGSVQLVQGSPTQYQTAAYKADGTALWTKVYPDGGQNGSLIHDIAVSPNGKRVFVTGESYPKDGFLSDIATIAYRSSDGKRLWVRRFDGPGAATDLGFSIGLSPDGATVFVTGVQTGTDSYYDYVTIAYSAGTGADVWTKTYDASGDGGEDIAYSLAVSPDGSRVAVTGLSTHTGGAGSELADDVATVSYDATTGAQQWASRFNGAGDDRDIGQDVVFSPDSARVYVVGFSGRDNSANYDDFVTLAYTASDGGELWSKLYDGPAHSEDVGKYIAVSTGGDSIVVTGRSIGADSTYDYATVAYDTAAGGLLWAKRYAGSGEDDPGGVAVAPDETAVYVTGSSVGSGGDLDFTTIAYGMPAGAKLWLRRWDRGAYDRAKDLVVAPGGGRVYVTGDTGKWATLAYKA